MYYIGCDAIHISEIDCGDPPEVKNATPVYNSTKAFNRVNHTCTGVGRFIDGSTSKLSECELSGNWSDVGSHCRGIYS